MSRDKVGALIVFTREASLEDYVKTGTTIDGQVSEQLIRNIFFPKAALHDGAMIIRDGRVAAAGCVLPLSGSDRLSADLGTRHRAGVGMSENSDAVVVIVSEETGTISVAMGGMLKRHLAPKTLEKLLRNALCPDENQEEDKIKCYGGEVHGQVDLETAFAESCNAAFCKIGSRLDVSQWRKTCESLYFNKSLPI